MGGLLFENSLSDDGVCVLIKTGDLCRGSLFEESELAQAGRNEFGPLIGIFRLYVASYGTAFIQNEAIVVLRD